MKHFLALLLISGYVALIPVCFFGGDHNGSLVPSAHAAGYEGKATNPSGMAAECPLQSTTCAVDNGSQAGLSHHSDMYASFSVFMQTQGFLILAIIFLSLLFAVVQNPLLFRIPVQIFTYIKKRREILSVHKSSFLKWLSLSINSPSYAFVM